MAAQFQLVMHSGPTPGKVFPLEGDVITIGRESGNAIIINDAEVSRKHTQFVFQGGKVVITDLGSTNGTFVNGQRLTGQHVLVPGEVISLGEQINLLFEAIATVDPNATMLSTGHQPASVAPMPAMDAPVSQPRPATPAPMSAPAPVYAGQIPSSPSPMSGEPPKTSGGNKSRTPIIIAVVVVLCLLCVCVSVGLYMAPCSFWAMFTGGTC